VGRTKHLSKAHAGFAEVIRRTRDNQLRELAVAQSPAEIAGHIDRLLDIERLLYEHALDTWRQEGRFHFAAFFAAAGSEFSRELMAMHSIWRRENGQSEPSDGS
jgi:hypothetical protein